MGGRFRGQSVHVAWELRPIKTPRSLSPQGLRRHQFNQTTRRRVLQVPRLKIYPLVCGKVEVGDRFGVNRSMSLLNQKHLVQDHHEGWKGTQATKRSPLGSFQSRACKLTFLSAEILKCGGAVSGNREITSNSQHRVFSGPNRSIPPRSNLYC